MNLCYNQSFNEDRFFLFFFTVKSQSSLSQRQCSHCGTIATGNRKCPLWWSQSRVWLNLFHLSKKKSKKIHIKQQHIDYINSQCCPSPHFHHPWGKQRLWSVLPGVQTLLKSAFHTTQHIRWYIHLNLFKIKKIKTTLHTASFHLNSFWRQRKGQWIN